MASYMHIYHCIYKRTKGKIYIFVYLEGWLTVLTVLLKFEEYKPNTMTNYNGYFVDKGMF